MKYCLYFDNYLCISILMKVSIIVGGRFHAFNLAEQLSLNKNLNQLITSYPKFYLKNKYQIEQEKINSIITKEILTRFIFKKIPYLENFSIKHFDNKASKIINFKNLDILIGWSSFSLASFIKAQKYGCIKILERGSTHIEFQNKILKEEYEINNLKPNLPSRFIIEKEKKEYEIADYISVPTEFVKKTFIEQGINENKIIKIPYGVDLNEFRKLPNLNLNNNNNIFRIIYTGSICIRKGLIYLLKAFTELNLKNTELLLIGEIENKFLKILNKFKNNDSIKILKSMNQSELYKYYNSSKIFVTCSIEDGLSMVQLQAMSCGLPIICTKNSGGEEIVTDGYDGFIIPIRNIEILKEKIKFFYENISKCNQMGENAKKKVDQYYSWESYGKNAIQTYQSLLQKK